MRVHHPAMLAVVAASGVLPAALMETVGDRPVQVAPLMHLLLVAIGAGTAGLAALGLSLAGLRARDGRTVIVATAFTTMTALLVVHGLATPGILIGMNGVVALAGGLSLPVGAAVLTLAAIPRLGRTRRPERLLWLQAGLFFGVLALGAFGMVDGAAVPSVPAAGTAPAVALTVVGGLLYGVLALRAVWTAALTRRRGDLLVAIGCAWLTAALIPQLLMGFGTAAFYGGHLLELAGIGLVAIPVLRDLQQGGSSRPLLGDLSAADLVAAEETYLGARVRSLLVTLAEADESTERHTRRVALRAVQVGERLRLPAVTLRELATGALLHDIGKLDVPPEILGKPGSLTDEEFAAIKRHPGSGLRLLKTLGGFSPVVLALVHEHHERLDGSGYPRGLHAADLSLPTRILAVCDVWDALTSDRVYRGAWDHERAFTLLRDPAHFDQACVDALEQVVTGEAAAAVAPARRAPRLAPAT